MLFMIIYLNICRCLSQVFQPPVDTDIKTHCLRSIRHSAFQLWSLLSEAVFMCASSLLYPTVYLQTGPAPGHGP